MLDGDKHVYKTSMFLFFDSVWVYSKNKSFWLAFLLHNENLIIKSLKQRRDELKSSWVSRWQKPNRLLVTNNHDEQQICQLAAVILFSSY